jgi:hypothetical protein
MDSFLKCSRCANSFDLDEYSPHILPCNYSICIKCIQQSQQLLGGFLIECTCDQKQHKLSSLHELYPCELITSYLKGLQEGGSHLDTLKRQLEFAQFSLEVAKYEANRHYDAMEMNIDIRAESLIEIIHEKRGLLHQEVKLQRRNTELEFEAIKEQHAADSQGLKAAFGNVSGVDEALSVIEKSSDQICVITFFFKSFTKYITRRF